MRCIVSAGPTYEPLDKVRRLTNFSSGRLGSELGDFLTDRGHNVTLLLGEQATFHGECKVHTVETFSTTTDLSERLRRRGCESVDAVFHAAAVSDVKFGKVCVRSAPGDLTEMQ